MTPATKCKEMQELTAKQLKAVQALLECSSIQQAALELKVNPATLHRWLKIPDFRAALMEAKREMVSRGFTRIQSKINAAVDTLGDIMTSSEASSNSRVTAAKSIIELSLKSLEMEDLSERIKKIEEFIQCQSKTKSKR